MNAKNPTKTTRQNHTDRHRAPAMPTATTDHATTRRPRRSLAILPAADRRGGFRVALVREVERLETLAGSRVAETANRSREHYLPWARVATSPQACGLKLRALLADRARALSVPPQVPEPLRPPPRKKWTLRHAHSLRAHLTAA